jgi:hypothetical protein
MNEKIKPRQISKERVHQFVLFLKHLGERKRAEAKKILKKK